MNDADKLHERMWRLQAELQRFGGSRTPLQLDFNGQRMVVAGSQIFSVPLSWSFQEFLLSYGMNFIGSELVAVEKDRNAPKHPLAKMLLSSKLQALQEANQPLQFAWANAALHAFIHFSWDLFTVADNAHIQAALIARLKKKDLYQGARYELFVAASLIRGGFTIAFEDESDISTTHCEFAATSRDTQKAFSVEAKSRHRTSSAPGQKTGAYRLLQKALQKAASHERIVFIDVNQPLGAASFPNQPWHQDVMGMVSLMEEQQDPARRWPQAILFFTNGTFSPLGRNGSVVLTAINHPLFKMRDSRIVKQAYPEIGKLFAAVDDLSATPHKFPGQDF